MCEATTTYNSLAKNDQLLHLTGLSERILATTTPPRILATITPPKGGGVDEYFFDKNNSHEVFVKNVLPPSPPLPLSGGSDGRV